MDVVERLLALVALAELKPHEGDARVNETRNAAVAACKLVRKHKVTCSSYPNLDVYIDKALGEPTDYAAARHACNLVRQHRWSLRIGVQPPAPTPRPGVSGTRTRDDDFDPFGRNVKTGERMTPADFTRIMQDLLNDYGRQSAQKTREAAERAARYNGERVHVHVHVRPGSSDAAHAVAEAARARAEEMRARQLRDQLVAEWGAMHYTESLLAEGDALRDVLCRRCMCAIHKDPFRMRRRDGQAFFVHDRCIIK